MTGPANLRIVIAGGGTGGHLYPALAIGEGILRREPAAGIHYVGSRFGLEATVLPAKELTHTLLAIRGFQRGRDARSISRNLLFPVRVLAAYRQAIRLINRNKPTVVVGTGGYASGLPLLAATRRGIPTLIQEQNSYPGITTRKLAARVDRVCLGFADARQFLPEIPTILTGNPVREGIAAGDRTQAAQFFNLDADRPTVFLFGGSQGSEILNRSLAFIAPQLRQQEIQVLWQTGTANFGEYHQFDSTGCRVVPFIDRMADAYALADLVLSRAGALALAEITLCAKPALLVPLASAAADHQTKNAASLVKQGAARMIAESELTRENLFQQIFKLIRDKKLLRQMGQTALSLAHPDATELIVNQILEMARS
ncbi:MAG: undecaprenyldiphospho-muramoylpentapeptide beta-N-acetylglucosaminyltransferase [Candidatus Neomarinimicrobiota bacterium]